MIIISIFTADQVEAAFVVRDGLNLAREQVHPGRRLRLVRMANVQEAIRRHSAASLLPHASHLALALLQQVPGPCDPVVLVALQLVQRVPGPTLLRRHMLHTVKVRGAAQEGL